MKELAPWLNWIAGTIAMWGLFAPVPHDTVIRLLIIVPGMAIGLALIFRSEVSLEETNDDDGKEIDANARPNLNLMLLLPALALAARALFSPRTRL